MLERTDENIVSQVQGGNTNIFGELVERYEQKMRRYARRFFASREDREDLVQDIFMKAYANIQDFDVRRRFSPWLYRIAHNVCVNALRQQSRWSFIPIDLDVLFPHPVARETADGDTVIQDMRRVLDASLAELPLKYREPLVLYYFEQLNYQEIADVLHIPTATVGVRLSRGKALLKKHLTPFV